MKGYTKRPAVKTIRYYCGMCDRWFTRGGDCPQCGCHLERGQK